MTETPEERQARMDRMLDELLIHPGRPRPAYLDDPARLQSLADDRAKMPENPRCSYCGSQAVSAVAGVQACNDCGMTGGTR
jgi:hypothetical protein